MNAQDSTTLTESPPICPPPLPPAGLHEGAEVSESGSRYPEAWTELERLRAARGNPLNGLVMLVATLALSLGIGTQRWTLEKAGLIVAILFVHELGHYVTMRRFGYRELRMFFVPLLGAAVTGRNYNVPGWKKAVVSLMGPLPGIFIGSGIGVWAAVTGNEWLARLGLLAVIVNVINLVPVLPLDGGWLWNAILFCRHYKLELAFKVFAALAAFGATIAGLGKLWMYLGIVTLVGLPLVSAHGRIASALRRRGVPALAGDSDAVPHEMGEAIFAELDQLMKGKLSPKAMATNALQIFERLNATPPSAIASIALAVLYFVAIVTAVVGFGCSGYVFYQGGDSGDDFLPNSARVEQSEESATSASRSKP